MTDYPSLKPLLEFIEELEELSKKYDITISGCFCCGSPNLNIHDTSKGHYTCQYTTPSKISSTIGTELEWTCKPSPPVKIT